MQFLFKARFDRFVRPISQQPFVCAGEERLLFCLHLLGDDSLLGFADGFGDFFHADFRLCPGLRPRDGGSGPLPLSVGSSPLGVTLGVKKWGIFDPENWTIGVLHKIFIYIPCFLYYI